MFGRVRFGLRQLALLTSGAVAATGLAVTASGGTPAFADAGYSNLPAVSDSLQLDVVGASTAPFAQIDVWFANSGDNQQWSYPSSNGAVGQIASKSSGMCITTDGGAGDTLFQYPCQNAANQQWTAEIWTAWWNPGGTMVTFLNQWSGLVMEVYGDSRWAGAAVDAWYPNGGLNQSWIVPGCSQICDYIP